MKIFVYLYYLISLRFFVYTHIKYNTLWYINFIFYIRQMFIEENQLQRFVEKYTR